MQDGSAAGTIKQFSILQGPERRSLGLWCNYCSKSTPLTATEPVAVREEANRRKAEHDCSSATKAWARPTPG